MSNSLVNKGLEILGYEKSLKQGLYLIHLGCISVFTRKLVSCANFILYRKKEEKAHKI